MKFKLIFTSVIVAAIAAGCSGEKKEQSGYMIDGVPFTSVKMGEGFWGQRLDAARRVTVPLAFSKCEESGRYDNFVRATHPSDTIKVGGFPFDDTDVYKTIEGASYLLQTYPDPAMEAYIDSVLTLVAAAQEPDGYLNTARTMNPAHPHDWMGAERWCAVENLSHEFYNLGHMVDGAVAHYQATGKTNFLDIARRYADCVVRNIGQGEGQVDRVPGHQIAEMALARLYQATGDTAYLRQAKYFLDRRGYTSRHDAYSQSHKPVLEQDEAVGHAVRAVYMYAGMADVAALTGDRQYFDAIDRIWDNIVGKKMYLTGGIGARHAGESFGDNYELPNAEAYCETCAAIGHVYVNHRLFMLHGDSKYYDVLERTLYNGVISGMSIDGGRFFYPNPLASEGGYERKPWFGCACCPSNLSRFIPSIPGYIYGSHGNDLYVNLFASNSAAIDLADGKVELSQTTAYPYDGNVAIGIDDNQAGKFSLKIRIPGWVNDTPVPSDLYAYADSLKGGYTIRVNGEEVTAPVEKGYATIERRWKKGDCVEVAFDMPARVVRANEAVEADRGLLAVERGPLVYCAEDADNESFADLALTPDTRFEAVACPDKLYGITELRAPGITLIPYYAWCHRGPGKMAVWLPEKKESNN